MKTQFKARKMAQQVTALLLSCYPEFNPQSSHGGRTDSHRLSPELYTCSVAYHFIAHKIKKWKCNSKGTKVGSHKILRVFSFKELRSSYQDHVYSVHLGILWDVFTNCHWQPYLNEAEDPKYTLVIKINLLAFRRRIVLLSLRLRK